MEKEEKREKRKGRIKGGEGSKLTRERGLSKRRGCVG
jgi:hypothetical protein